MKQLIQLLKSKKRYILKSEGNSMQPVLFSNDILYYRKIKFDQIKINNLIILDKDKRIITHRVIYKTNKYLITKGDNNLESDGKIYPNQIIGKVYQVKRNGQIISPDSIYLLQSTAYFQEIVKIKKAFKKENIDLVFLKGLPLHLYYEKSHPRRIYADCDILVNRKDNKRTDEILRKHGFKSIDNSITSVLGKLKNRVTEVSYIKSINDFNIIIDVHFDAITLINQFGTLNDLYPIEKIESLNIELLRTKKDVTIISEKYPILSESNNVLYQAYNIFHHNFRGSFRYDLLDKVIQKEISVKILKHVQDDVRKYKLQGFVYPVFLLLKKYYDFPLPKSFSESIKSDKDKLNYIKKNILNINIFDDETRIQAGISRFRNLFFLSPNSWQKRLMILFNIRVIYSVFWVIIFLLRRSLSKLFKSF